MKINEWVESTLGNKYDVDGYYSYQCWDYFAYFLKQFNLTNVNTHCSITGYVGDLWKERLRKGYSLYFEFITDKKFKDGDWLFWDKHVGMYYKGMLIGQNQNNKPEVTSIPLDDTNVIGAFRYKNWDRGLSIQMMDIFIKALYRGMLGREADRNGLAYWKNQMMNGLSCDEVFKGIYVSKEYLSKHKL